MADGGDALRLKPHDISGGSLQEAELPIPGVAWPARAARSESPLAQGLRRFRRSTTALVGAAIVVGLVLVALFADALAPRSPIASDQTRTFARPSWDYPLGTDQLGRDYQQVQGFALVTALAFVVINLIVDLTYTFLDPRIRYA